MLTLSPEPWNVRRLPQFGKYGPCRPASQCDRWPLAFRAAGSGELLEGRLEASAATLTLSRVDELPIGTQDLLGVEAPAVLAGVQNVALDAWKAL